MRQAVAAEQAAAEAILAAARAGEEWRRAADCLDVVRLAFGDRRLPAPETLEGSTDLGASGIEGALLAELEVAHRAVEEAERELDAARMPALAVATRHRLARARQREQAVLSRMGFVSWLAFQIHRVDVLLGQDAEAVPGAPGRPATDPGAAVADQVREARLRRTLEEAESACRTARVHVEAGLAQAGILPGPDDPDDLAARVSALSRRASEAALHRRTPPTAPILQEVEAELSEARAALAALSRPEWDEGPLVSDTPLPDPEPLLEERARVFEEAYRMARDLPDVGPLEARHDALIRRIADLEAASQAGFHLKAVEEAENVLLDRVAQVHRVGLKAEPIPLLVDDALAGYALGDKHDLLHLLARLAEATQVVYLTNDRETLDWASVQAREGGALVVPPPAVPPPAIASVA